MKNRGKKGGRWLTILIVALVIALIAVVLVSQLIVRLF